MAKVTIEIGDEVELVQGPVRFMLGRLMSTNMTDVQREDDRRYVDPQMQQHLIQGPVVSCSVQLDFVVERQYFELTPANQLSVCKAILAFVKRCWRFYKT